MAASQRTLLNQEGPECEQAEDDGSDGSEGDQPIQVKREKEISYDAESPEEGIYGMAVASMIIDTRKILKTTGDKRLRHVSRLMLVMLIVFFTLGLQLYVTLMTKFIVTPDAVADIRTAYGDYEAVMYSGHTTVTRFGHARGVEGFFNISKFAELSKDDQQVVCNFPLSEPVFLWAILFLWTVTCLRYVRKNLSFTHRLMMISTDVYSMGDPEVFDRQEIDGGKTRVVRNITLLAKFFLLVFIQLPTLLMNMVLLWVGCRYLTATVGFGEVLLNAIALEFILMTHELLYHTIVPHSMRQDLSTLVIPHPSKRQAPTWGNMLGTFGVLLFAITWCAVYVRYLQQVLPDYKWDIQPACEAHKLARDALIV